MEKKRVFRMDYSRLHREYQFKSGDVATIIEEDKPIVKIKVNQIPYIIPYRDFIITTKPATE